MTHTYLTTYLTRAEIDSIREVASQYDLTDDEVERLIGQIDRSVCNRTHEAYLKAHAGAAAIERLRSEEDPQQAARRRPIDECQFSIWTLHALQGIGCMTLGDVAKRTRGQLLKTKGVGLRTLRDIELTLEDCGLGLADE